MGRKSKNKGASYELKVAKMFTEWWGGKFSRVPASGGLHWGSDQRVAGDIVPPPEADFPFVTECKKRENWTFDHIVLDIGQPREWWEQVVNDGRRVDQVPMLIFSRNRAKDFIMVPYSKYIEEQLEGYNDVIITHVTTVNIREEVQRFKVIVTTFDTFSQTPKENLKKYAKEVEWDPYADQYK